MSDKDIFGGWSTEALKEYLRDNGGTIPPNATKDQLVTEAGKVARKAETAIMTANRGNNNPNNQQPVIGTPMWPPPLAQHQGHPPPEGAMRHYPHVHPQQPQHVPAPMPRPGTRKKALIIGCNYFGTRAQLNGCINDAKCMSYLLQHKMGFPQSNMLILTDDNPNPTMRPTKYNIYQGIQWLMTDMRPGDSLVFHFSGHGSQQRDYTGQEADGMNETICPIDFQQAGEIVDDELNRMLVQPIRQGVKLHAIIDACHSGSALDLPYQAVCHHGHIQWQSEYAPQNLRQWKAPQGGFAVQISAAMDNQVAADTNKMTGIHTGAATYSFIKCIEERGLNITYKDLLAGMYYTLQQVSGGGGGGGGFNTDSLLGGMLGGLLGSAMGGSSFKGQEPVLSSGCVFDLNHKLEL